VVAAMTPANPAIVNFAAATDVAQCDATGETPGGNVTDMNAQAGRTGP
jgi:hypothetical protein